MKEECSIHGKKNRTVSLTLWSLLGIGLLIIIYHVWRHASGSFLTSFVKEIFQLLFNRKGVVMELWEIAPYFFIGVVIAGFIRTYKFHIRLRNTLNRYGFASIFFASLIGVFSPLCSCGILTTVIALLAAGLPLAPAMALLISSPLMSVTTFFLTIGDLGIEWAIIRVIVAFLMGVSAGLVTHMLRNYFKTSELFLEGGIPEGDFHDPNYADERLRCSCGQKFSNRLAAKHKNKFVVFLAKSVEMIWLLGKYVLVGIIIGSIAERYISPEYINTLFGEGQPFNIILVTFGSIPVFLHQISASSILYHIKASLPGTIDSGAALAFLIGGPVTAIPAMVLLWSMFKKRTFVLYMSISVIGTICFAYLFRLFVFIPYVNLGDPLLKSVHSLTAGECAVIKKIDDNIKITLAPDNKAQIAAYEDIEGGSGLVFDACIDRFKNGGSNSADNWQYILNIAQWLENTIYNERKDSILIYNTYQSSGYNNNYFKEDLVSLLSDNNRYKITVTNRKEVSNITRDFLSAFGQLWIIEGEDYKEKDATLFRKEEIEVIKNFKEDGNGVLLVARPIEKGADCSGNVNLIAREYGVEFYGYASNKSTLVVSALHELISIVEIPLKKFFMSLR
ncbi:MAG: permease [bacterium]